MLETLRRHPRAVKSAHRVTIWVVAPDRKVSIGQRSARRQSRRRPITQARRAMGPRPRAREAGRLAAVVDVPEVNVALFAWLLNFPWELWQVPFYEGMSTMAYWSAIKSCTGALLGDAAIAVGAFWVVAIWARSRRWILRPTRRDVVLFVLAGAVARSSWSSTRRACCVAGPMPRRCPWCPFSELGSCPCSNGWCCHPWSSGLVRRQLT